MALRPPGAALSAPVFSVCVAALTCRLAFGMQIAPASSAHPSRPRRIVADEALSLNARFLRTSANSTVKEPKPAGWFDSFSESESTYDEGAKPTSPDFPLYKVLDGWSPKTGGSAPGLPAAHFHESPSAGWEAAWETHYPSVQTDGKWYRGGGGSWNEQYVPFSKGDSSVKPADWFDSDVNQYDNFGRRKEPYAGSGDRYWWAEKRAVNTTLTCQSQGCVGNTTIQAFDGTKERALKCVMNFKVHATDFDEDYSSEMVEWILVNDVTVKAPCKPGTNGCKNGGQAGKAIYPCFTDLDITHLVPWQGTLNIAAKISDTVDECPYNGNLLSAIPIVTCVVIPQNPSPMLNGAPNFPAANGPSSDSYSASDSSSGTAGWQFGDASGNGAAGGVVPGSPPPGLVPGMRIGDNLPNGEPYFPFGDLSNAVHAYDSASLGPGVQGAYGSPGGYTGATGGYGPNGVNGGYGVNGPNGAYGNGAYGPNGANGGYWPNGANGAYGNGAYGPNGANGGYWPNGANGAYGPIGANGPYGVDGSAGSSLTDGVTWDMGENSVGVLPGSTNSTIAAMVGDSNYRAIAPLNCIERGCTAFVMMQLNSTAVHFGHCTLSVYVNQTDFDESESVEAIEYIGTENRNLSYNLHPGSNPCEKADLGTPMTQTQMVYKAVDAVDITTDAADGYLMLLAKISPFVDECASNGYLFNAIAQVDCKVSNARVDTGLPPTVLLQSTDEHAQQVTRLRGGQAGLI